MATISLIILDKDHLKDELEHLKLVLLSNGYKDKQIIDTIKKACSVETRNQREDNFVTNTILPYIHGTTNKIVKILRRRNIKVVFSDPNSLRDMLDSTKDSIDMKL